MIENIYSKVDPNKLLHFIHRVNEDMGRTNLVSPMNYLQCSFMVFKEGTTFKPHKHIEKNRSFEKMIAQESWLVIRGKVKCIFYDIDDTILSENILNPGDASFTLYGGHNYVILEENTIVYEYKTGPYEGIDMDKQFIGE
jgi:cupin fold WbuC family metalloprotein